MAEEDGEWKGNGGGGGVGKQQVYRELNLKGNDNSILCLLFFPIFRNLWLPVDRQSYQAQISCNAPVWTFLYIFLFKLGSGITITLSMCPLLFFSVTYRMKAFDDVLFWYCYPPPLPTVSHSHTIRKFCVIRHSKFDSQHVSTILHDSERNRVQFAINNRDFPPTYGYLSLSDAQRLRQ